MRMFDKTNTPKKPISAKLNEIEFAEISCSQQAIVNIHNVNSFLTLNESEIFSRFPNDKCNHDEHNTISFAK